MHKILRDLYYFKMAHKIKKPTKKKNRSSITNFKGPMFKLIRFKCSLGPIKSFPTLWKN